MSELAPEIIKNLADRKAADQPEVWQVPISVSRANSASRVAASGIPKAIFKIENRFINGSSADLPIRIYHPKDENNLPALVFFHGGGWALNFLDIYDKWLIDFSLEANCKVISVFYQKAPEHPFPIPFDDCYETLEWVYKNSDSLGINKSQIGVGGDSAGGNLAAGVAIKAQGKIPLAFQLLIYPATAKDFNTESYSKYGQGYGLSKKSMEWFWNAYLPNNDNDRNPYACPAHAEDISNLAPAVIVTAQFDPLLDDGVKYKEKLEAGGVKVIYKNYEDMIHGFMVLPTVTSRAEELSTDCANFIRELIKR